MRSKYEAKCEKELKEEGWLVDTKKGMSRFATERDYWHLFDIIAVKKGCSLRFISVKGHNRGSKEHHEALKNFWLPDSCQKEIWIWPNNKKKKEWIKKIIPNNSDLRPNEIIRRPQSS